MAMSDRDGAAAVSDEFQELQRLYEKFCGPVSEAVLKARWQMIEPNDLLSWDMRRGSSTGLAYMEQELINTFAAIETAGYRIVAADRWARVRSFGERMYRSEFTDCDEWRNMVAAKLLPGDLGDLDDGGAG